MTEHPHEPEILERRGALQTAAEVSTILAPFVAPAVAQVTGHFLKPKEEPPHVILPPGVDLEQ